MKTRWLAVFLAGISFAPVVAAEEPQVRVAILQEAENFRLTVPNPCRALDLKTSAVLAEWPNLLWQEVRSDGPGLRVGQTTLASDAVVIQQAAGSLFRINSRAYRGRLILRRSAASKVTAINQLGLEEYLVGAVASEAHPDWPSETLKAHAVVSRTVVAHRMWVNQNRPFDVTADTSTHLYYGISAERESTQRAVEATRGQVLTWEGELFSTTFHANCGGHTEDAAELWASKKPLPPLKGVADSYCKDRRHYRWSAKLRLDEFKKLLGEEAAAAGDLTRVEVVERNRSGRVRSVRLAGNRGEVRLTGRRFRELLGANRLRSLKFNIKLSGSEVIFSGFGWGHGVGFCQWGAYGMARQGKKMDEILAHYFPGAQRKPLQGLPGFS